MPTYTCMLPLKQWTPEQRRAIAQAIRRGFATNSSSTHSILEVEPGQPLPAPVNAEWDEKIHVEHDDFIASDYKSRLNYLHAMAADGARYAGDWSDEDGTYRRYLQLAAVIPGGPLESDKVRDMGLDSLSPYAVPRKIHSPDMDVDFFAHIVRLLLSENMLIFGGAWFDGRRWEEELKGKHINLLQELDTVSRRVGENEWTVLDLGDGKKYGVRFDAAGRQQYESVIMPRASADVR